jgi:DNA processing protein
MTDREACIVLNMISGVGHAKFRALAAEFGSPAAVCGVPAARLEQVAGIGPTLGGRIAGFDWEGSLVRELELAERGGVRIFTLYDDAYPAVLRELYDPPLTLYVRGELPEFDRNTLAVIGSRRMSRYGGEMTAALTADAVAAGFKIVSGLAFGVDTVAHATTVEQGGVTVAVLGGGLAKVHPQENLPLARRIIETGGAVVSEFPMNFPVNRTSFPRRNRIVARLSNGILVTEAGVDSGAMITANLGLDFGLTVMAVPGRADNPQSRGCHRLIRQGAALVEEIADILNAMECGLLPGLNFHADAIDTGVAYDHEGRSDLSDEARQVLARLEEGEAGFDELAAATGLDTGRLTGVLMKLEMQMLIRRFADQSYALRRNHPAAGAADKEDV